MRGQQDREWFCASSWRSPSGRKSMLETSPEALVVRLESCLTWYLSSEQVDFPIQRGVLYEHLPAQGLWGMGRMLSGKHRHPRPAPPRQQRKCLHCHSHLDDQEENRIQLLAHPPYSLAPCNFFSFCSPKWSDSWKGSTFRASSMLSTFSRAWFLAYTTVSVVWHHGHVARKDH